jgi:hypothetical protein
MRRSVQEVRSYKNLEARQGQFVPLSKWCRREDNVGTYFGSFAFEH